MLLEVIILLKLRIIKLLQFTNLKPSKLAFGASVVELGLPPLGRCSDCDVLQNMIFVLQSIAQVSVLLVIRCILYRCQAN